MSVQEDLLNLVSTNSEFRQSITAATTAEEAVKLAADHGIEISVEDLRTAFKSRMSELSEKELEAVSGGKGCGKAPTPIGEAKNAAESAAIGGMF